MQTLTIRNSIHKIWQDVQNSCLVVNVKSNMIPFPDLWLLSYAS